MIYDEITATVYRFSSRLVLVIVDVVGGFYRDYGGRFGVE